MEPNKIEKQLREKLNSREIQPSAQAWDRLDAMLSIAEEKKTKHSFGWLYIAASILVFVSVGMYFYNQDRTKINTTETVVGNENNKDAVIHNTNAVAEKEIENTVLSSETQSSDPTINTKSNKSSIANNNKLVIAQTHQKTNSASIINKEKEIEFQNSSDVALKNLPKTMTPDKEIVIAKSTITNKDEIASVDVKKSDNISKVKVNANNLLSEVDGELELTFREKVFKKVNKNYKEVKVTLANRNNL